MGQVNFSDLPKYDQSKIIEVGRAYRLAHHKEILIKIVEEIRTSHSLLPEAQPPSGALMYDCERWKTVHWLWMSYIIMKIHDKGGK